LRDRLAAAVCLSLLALVCLVASSCDHGGEGGAWKPFFPEGSAMARIVERGRLVVGVKYDVPLFGFRDPSTQQLDGFDVDLAREIGRALGLREDQVEFVEAITANRIPFLLEDKVDIIVSTFTITEERKTQVDFSRPYYEAGQSILVKRDNASIKGLEDLNGRRVCAQAASTSQKTLVERAPGAEVLAPQVISTCIQALRDGRVDAVSTDNVQLAGFASRDVDLRLVGGNFTRELYGVGVKKGKAELVRFIDGEIGRMLSDGRWQRIYSDNLGGIEGLPPPAEAKTALPSAG
jgi:glutamate transport system substrate-binding protein